MDTSSPRCPTASTWSSSARRTAMAPLLRSLRRRRRPVRRLGLEARAGRALGNAPRDRERAPVAAAALARPEPVRLDAARRRSGRRLHVPLHGRGLRHRAAARAGLAAALGRGHDADAARAHARALGRAAASGARAGRGRRPRRSAARRGRDARARLRGRVRGDRLDAAGARGAQPDPLLVHADGLRDHGAADDARRRAGARARVASRRRRVERARPARSSAATPTGCSCSAATGRSASSAQNRRRD